MNNKKNQAPLQMDPDMVTALIVALVMATVMLSLNRCTTTLFD